MSNKGETYSNVLSWSPLPPRRKLGWANNNNTDKKNAEGKSEPLYPDYDNSIWLRSCSEEIKVPLKGQIKGAIPTWLNGSLIRNGPGLLQIGNDEFQHLFDCSALLHRFGIENGTVTYQCRFLQSEVYKRNHAAKRIVITEFGTKRVEEPCRSIFKKISSIFNTDKNHSDNSLVSVYPFGDELYAFGEVPIIHQIDSDTLETVGMVNVSKYVSIVHHSSHPHIWTDGTVYNLGLSASINGTFHNVVEFPKTKEGSTKQMFEKARIVASVPARWPFSPSYMHSFGITENYYIITEQPMCLFVPELFRLKFNNDPVIGCFRWYDDEYTNISVVSRKTGKIYRTFLAETFSYMHIINQYEDESYIILDICIYTDPSIMEGLYIESLKTSQQNLDYPKMFRSRPARFVLPLEPNPKGPEDANLIQLKNTQAKACYLANGNILITPERLVDLSCELPTINYGQHVGRPYRYFYAVNYEIDSELNGHIVKVDTECKSLKQWGQKNCYLSEPIFVPNPESKEEDDGVILSTMVWGKENANQVGLVVLDAKSFTELGRVEFQTPGPVPSSFHGWFLTKTE